LLGELTALPQILWLDLRGPSSKGKRKGKGRRGEEKGLRGKGRGKWEGNERGRHIAWPDL